RQVVELAAQPRERRVGVRHREPLYGPLAIAHELRAMSPEEPLTGALIVNETYLARVEVARGGERPAHAIPELQPTRRCREARACTVPGRAPDRPLVPEGVAHVEAVAGGRGSVRRAQHRRG